MSATCGTPRSTTGSSVSSVAASAGSAAFLAPRGADPARRGGSGRRRGSGPSTATVGESLPFESSRTRVVAGVVADGRRADADDTAPRARSTAPACAGADLEQDEGVPGRDGAGRREQLAIAVEPAEPANRAPRPAPSAATSQRQARRRRGIDVGRVGDHQVEGARPRARRASTPPPAGPRAPRRSRVARARPPAPRATASVAVDRGLAAARARA